MKIAIVGCGALGSFYGARLCRQGHEVHFLLRSDYEAVRQQGVRILSPDGDFAVRPHAAGSPGEIGISDLVLIGLKTTANDQFPRLLPPLVGVHTAVLTLQNGLGNEDHLARLFPPAQILGGLCFVCLNRLQPGLIQHTAHGRIVLGEHRRPPLDRTHALADLLRASGTPCDVAPNLERAHWEKLVWNVPFNGLGVAGTAGYEAVLSGCLTPERAPTPCLTTDLLLGDARWFALLQELMAEVLRGANALGYDLPASLVEENIARTRVMESYKASTLVDFERGQPLEVDSLFLEPLRQAADAGMALPRLAALAAILRQIDPARRF